MGKPIAICSGDPAGIGPEIVERALAANPGTPAVVFGHAPTLESAFRGRGDGPEPQICTAPQPVDAGRVCVVPCGEGSEPITHPGQEAARAQAEALERAVDAVLADECSALVTAPVSKELVSTVIDGFTGHTEYLARRAGRRADEVTMIFSGERFSVALIATHVALADVPHTINADRYERTTRHLAELLRARRPDRRPRIAVAALNPHAGEGGLFGAEEREVIAPFCESFADRDDVELTGPVPADAVFRAARDGVYDGVVAAYHDQAMIPLKLAGPGGTVNLTWGLPFVRTSPDHGVAHDLRGLGRADPAGMIAALGLARELANGSDDS